MAINRRIKKESPEQAQARAAWSEIQSKQFNANSNLFNYHQRFWDEHWPRLLERVRSEKPKLAARLEGDCSWDRKMIGLLYFLEGEPSDTRPWPSDDERQAMADVRRKAEAGDTKTSPARPTQLKLKLKRTPGKTGHGKNT